MVLYCSVVFWQWSYFHYDLVVNRWFQLISSQMRKIYESKLRSVRSGKAEWLATVCMFLCHTKLEIRLFCRVYQIMQDANQRNSWRLAKLGAIKGIIIQYYIVIQEQEVLLVSTCLSWSTVDIFEVSAGQVALLHGLGMAWLSWNLLEGDLSRSFSTGVLACHRFCDGRRWRTTGTARLRSARAWAR
jgi:hypothetical protein